MAANRSDSPNESNATDDLIDQVSRAAKTSRTASGFGTCRRWSRGSVVWVTALAVLQGLEATLERWVKNSRGYRWLTTEPDPDVIVIDLRETMTVGPLLRVLDRILAVVIPAVVHSRTGWLWKSAVRRLRDEPLRIVGGLLLFSVAVGAVSALLAGSFDRVTVVALSVLSIGGLLAFRDQRSWAELRTTRLLRVLAAAFVPPEPPDDEDR